MKFLFISPRFSGGIGGHAAMLADQLSEKGHEVTKMKIPYIPIKNLKNPSFAIFGTIKGILKSFWFLFHLCKKFYQYMAYLVIK